MKHEVINFEDDSIEKIAKACKRLWKDNMKEYLPEEKEKFSNDNEEDDDEDDNDDEKTIIKDAIRYRRYHSKLVANIAIEIFDDNFKQWAGHKKNEDMFRKTLYTACLLHDIRKLDDYHCFKGAEWVENNISKYIMCDDYIDDIYQVIRNHSLEKDLEGELRPAIKVLVLIIRIADKASKLQENSNYKEIKKLDKKIRMLFDEAKEYIDDKKISEFQNIDITFEFNDGVMESK